MTERASERAREGSMNGKGGTYEWRTRERVNIIQTVYIKRTCPDKHKASDVSRYLQAKLLSHQVFLKQPFPIPRPTNRHYLAPSVTASLHWGGFFKASSRPSHNGHVCLATLAFWMWCQRDVRNKRSARSSRGVALRQMQTTAWKKHSDSIVCGRFTWSEERSWSRTNI